ncbi:class I SAM-dependent methyltransferase [Methanobrevibacter filiformis]|uniref:Ubiquinone/menaquinone biosynthesis C-methyltransferase UbiE n=1 Tax=Methanobrevibacter filiformis TaxID=55758 RepID=A0A162FK24_9EURY|nr:methyltransferase domain-containing protein [Methanobrevibacter filiformis]KZX11180.1 ubiquinone/menaquinone biosynthesis C-methyltransferase UbiE [Methanobrevibacter filiformis]
MRVRESGMPEQLYWESLFDIDLIMEKMDISKDIDLLVEFGSGYGTFTIPSAGRINGKIIALDIDLEMLKIVNSQLDSNNIKNVTCHNRDFITEGTGVKDSSVDYVMLFNILHHSKPQEILNESYRILKFNGRIGIIHWNYDSTTPRGPNMSIRPKPEDLIKLVQTIGFKLKKEDLVNLPPYHYGIIAYK